MRVLGVLAERTTNYGGVRLSTVTQRTRTPDDLLIVVPARVSSHRFPAKALAPLAGRTVIRNVVDRIRESELGARLVVATDSRRIADELQGVCEVVAVDGPQLRCGSDRVAAAAERLGSEATWVLNIQGDEACLPAPALRTWIDALSGASAPLVTACVPMTGREGASSQDVVKVALTPDGRAADFDRGPIGEPDDRWLRHVGLYAFRREALREFARLPSAPRELDRSLEQLRALDAGWPIDVVVLDAYQDRPWPSINRPQDLPLAARYLAEAGLVADCARLSATLGSPHRDTTVPKPAL